MSRLYRASAFESEISSKRESVCGPPISNTGRVGASRTHRALQVERQQSLDGHCTGIHPHAAELNLLSWKHLEWSTTLSPTIAVSPFCLREDERDADEDLDFEDGSQHEESSNEAGTKNSTGPKGRTHSVGQWSEGCPSSNSSTSEPDPEPASYIGNLPQESREARHMKRELSKFLNLNNTSGEYCCHAVTAVPVNPGLQIRGFGLVSLPITDKVATSLVQHHQSLNKTSNGNVAVFGGAEIELVNKQWESAMKSAQTACFEVLYPGSERTLSLVDPRFVLCTTDTGLDTAFGNSGRPDMLGMCMFTLPSIHEGFRIELTTDTERETLSFGNEDCFSSLRAAWLQDTKARLSRMAGRCFAALIYDIVECQPSQHTSKPISSTALQVHERMTKLERLLTKWFKAPADIRGSATSLAFRLSDCYTKEEQLSLGKLDPRDRAVIRLLDKVCEGTPYTICLANLSRTIVEDERNDSENEVECPSNGIKYFETDSTRLVMVSDLQGHVIAEDAEFDRTWLVQDDVYDKYREPDDEDHERDHQNYSRYSDEWEEGASRHRYDDTVVLILTRTNYVDLLVWNGLSSDTERARSIQEASERCKNEPADRKKSLYLQTLCRQMLDKLDEEKKKTKAASDYWSLNFSRNPSVARSPKQDLLFLIIDAITEQPKSETVVEILQKAIEILEITQEEDLDKIIRILTVIDFEAIACSLNEPFKRISQLKERYERIQALEHRCLQSIPSAHPQLRNWAAKHLAGYYRSRSQSTVEVVLDEQLLTQLSLSYQYIFMDAFRAPGMDIYYCEALLRGLLQVQHSGADADAFAFVTAQLPAIVHTVITVLKAGEISVHAPIARLIVDAGTLNIDLCNPLVRAILDSPAMRSRQGGINIPAMFENQLGAIIELHARRIRPDQIATLNGLFESLATNFYVFQVGRHPQRFPNLQRMYCSSLCHLPQGQEVNRFLQDPQAEEFTSVGWDSRTRDNIMRLVQSEDLDLTVRIDKVRPAKTYQMHLRKVDHVYDKACNTWSGKRSRYLRMVEQLHCQGFLRDDRCPNRYQYLKTEDLHIMESRVLPHDRPLYPNKYFIWSLSRTTTPVELTAMIEKEGGRVVPIEEIDGPDVIGINARWPAPLNFSRSSLRYWQPRIVSEDEMLRVLRECQEKPSRVDGKRKVDASMHHQPLAENPNSAGHSKRRKTHDDDNVEIIDLVDD
ncbi:hypothetical protein LTS15_004894 [Exophiala xenobiotica]|nr:hypothetical protein LTS15_004894 [Exophiala xenobiotica]